MKNNIYYGEKYLHYLTVFETFPDRLRLWNRWETPGNRTTPILIPVNLLLYDVFITHVS